MMKALTSLPPLRQLRLQLHHDLVGVGITSPIVVVIFVQMLHQLHLISMLSQSETQNR